MGLATSSSPSSLAKRFAVRVLGAVAPRLLRRIQVARARRRFSGEPIAGPEFVLLEPTTGCNYHCIMCPDHSPRLDSPLAGKILPFDRAERLLRELARMGTKEIRLAGRGEPLIHPQMAEMIGLISGLGMRSVITTNGGRLTEDLAAKLCENGLSVLNISLNAGTPETYECTHQAPAENRTRLLDLVRQIAARETKPRLLASFVVTKINHAELVSFAQDSLAAGFDGLVVSSMLPVPFEMGDLSLTQDEWRRVRTDLATLGEMTQQAGKVLTIVGIPGDPDAAPAGRPVWPYSKMSCFIGYVFTVVDAFGNVHGCCTCRNLLGSVAEASFDQVWHSQAYRRYRIACRELPLNRQPPLDCNCFDCGNLRENLGLAELLHIPPVPEEHQSQLVNRLDLAQMLWQHFGKALPPSKEAAGFDDLNPTALPARTRRAIARLQALGILFGRYMPDGRLVFETARITSRLEAGLALERVLRLLGHADEEAEALVKAAAPKECLPEDMLLKEEARDWVERIRVEMRRQR